MVYELVAISSNSWRFSACTRLHRHVFFTEYGTVHQERSHLSFPLGIRPENPNHSLGLTLEKET